MNQMGAVFVGRRVEKPWGAEFIWAETDQYVGKTLYIERGEATSVQYHQRKDETICVLSGVLDLELGSPNGGLEAVRLQVGHSAHIPPGTRHRLTAIETCAVLEVSTPELDDVVRLEDRYGRVTT